MHRFYRNTMLREVARATPGDWEIDNPLREIWALVPWIAAAILLMWGVL